MSTYLSPTYLLPEFAQMLSATFLGYHAHTSTRTYVHIPLLVLFLWRALLIRALLPCPALHFKKRRLEAPEAAETAHWKLTRPVWTMPQPRSYLCSAIFGSWVSSMAGPWSSSVSKRALLQTFLVSAKTMPVTGPCGRSAILVICRETCLNSLPSLTSSKSLAPGVCPAVSTGSTAGIPPPPLRGSFSPPRGGGLVPHEICRGHVTGKGERGQASGTMLPCPMSQQSSHGSLSLQQNDTKKKKKVSRKRFAPFKNNNNNK